MHNLSTVFWFEVIRTLKKKSFWLVSMSFPLMIAAVFGIVYFSNQATSNAFEKAAKEKFSLIVTDEADRLNDDLLAGFGAMEISDRDKGIAMVESGKIDAYFYYPEKLGEEKVKVYARDVGIFDNGRYNALAEQLLRQSVSGSVDQSEVAVLTGAVDYDVTTYRDGEEYNAISHIIAPGFFLVLFYFLIAMFANQMLTSTTEEKENRVIEMLLTTVKARTLIVGKVLSLIVLAIIQAALVTAPAFIIYFVANSQLDLPVLDLSTIVFDPARIAISITVFAVSFMLFTGILVAISAAVPTAKEANNFFGIVMIMVFGPLYASPLFISSPDAGIVQALTYFPLTAPIPLMLRNAVGNLDATEATIAIAIMAITTIVVLNIAIRVFKYGALEYSRKLSLSEILRPMK